MKKKTFHKHKNKFNDIKQKNFEFLKKYYERVNDLFIVTNDQNYIEKVNLNQIEKIHFKNVIKKFIDDVNNVKFRKITKMQYLNFFDFDI